MHDIDLIENLKDTLFRIGEYLPDETLKKLIDLTKRVLENPYKPHIELSQTCSEDNECYAKVKILDKERNETLKIVYKIDKNNENKKEIIYTIGNILTLHIDIEGIRIKKKYYPSEPDNKTRNMINFYIDQIKSELQQQYTYLFF